MIGKLKYILKNYLPSAGILIFAALYIYSASLYPGGSQADRNAKGFDWVNNYWCTMFAVKGMNGEPNPARPFSITGMIVLWISLLRFFFMFSEIFFAGLFWKRIIRISGTLSVIFASLLITRFHDFMTTTASIFGLLTLAGIVTGIAGSSLKFYKITGIVCIILIGINNYIYYSRQFIYALPLIQKFTFVIVLLWIIGLNHVIVLRKRTITDTE